MEHPKFNHPLGGAEHRTSLDHPIWKLKPIVLCKHCVALKVCEDNVSPRLYIWVAPPKKNGWNLKMGEFPSSESPFPRVLF